ncbi:hypothetical protein [Pectobacterium cacticida]|uniref:hypothetical protein n=1 Tax=Pectobacterium cacticida TaxID=69221 RepID=UPI003985B51F
MEKAIIGNVAINRARIATEGITSVETEEQRRIAALEEKVNQLSAMVSHLQCMITIANN